MARNSDPNLTNLKIKKSYELCVEISENVAVDKEAAQISTPGDHAKASNCVDGDFVNIVYGVNGSCCHTSTQVPLFSMAQASLVTTHLSKDWAEFAYHGPLYYCW